jgi:CHAT domain-containing protein
MNTMLGCLLTLLVAAGMPALQTGAVEAKPQAEKLLAAGIEQMSSAHWDPARAALEQALAAFQKAGDRQGEARALKELGNLWYSSDAPARAVEVERHALDIAHQLGDRDLEARLLNNLGLAVRATQGDEEAYELFRQSAELAHGQKGSGIVEAMALANQADIDLARDDARKALPSLERAAKIARPLDNRGLAARVLATLARVYGTLGDHREAARLYEEAVPHATASGQKLGEAAILNGWGLELLTLGQPDKSAAASAKASAIAHELGDEETEAAALVTLALAYEAIADSKREEETAQRLLKVASDLKNETFQAAARRHLENVDIHETSATEIERQSQGLGAALERKDRAAVEQAAQSLGFLLGSLAGTERVAGNSAAAEKYANRLLAEARKADDPWMTGVALYELGQIAIDRGDLPQAIGLLRQSVDALKGTRDAGERLENALFSLAVALVNVGDYDTALSNLANLAEISRKSMHRKMEAFALQGQADALLMKGDRKSAAKFLAAAAVLGQGLGDPDVEAPALATLGLIAFGDNDNRRAIECWQKYLAAVRRPAPPVSAGLNRQMEAIGLGLLSRAHANLGESARGLELANSALAIAGEKGEPFDRALALDVRAYVYLRSEQLAEAEADALEAINLFERERAKLGDADLAKAGALDQVSTLYDLLEQILIRRGRPLEALQVAERGRAQAFVETLKGQMGKTVSPELPERVARKLGATLVEYAILHDPAQFLIPGRIEGLQAAFEDELLIWVVRPNGEVTLRSFDLKKPGAAGGAGETLAARLGYLLESMETSGSGPDRQKLLRDLYDELIAPIADLLPTDPDAPVVFVPQGVLFLAPFALLVDPAGHFLIQKHTLLTAPSIASLSKFQQPVFPARWAAADALIVGNPKLSPKAGKLASLSRAEEEARKIAALLNVEPLVGDGAGKERVLRALPSARLVHFATHGLLEWGNHSAQRGALALAPAGEADDGLLTAGEIRALELNAALVVLSACQTGRGRISGDGVIGLSRSFLAAGAASVVTSLWRIPDDEATASMMVDFHRRLAASGDPARSLRGAMLGAIGHGQDPRSWAGFTYMGAPVPKRLVPKRLVPKR